MTTWNKIVKWFITYGKYVVFVVGVGIIGIITVTTLNKFGTAKLFTNIKEWAFLKDHGYKKGGDVIVDKTTGTTIPVPEPYKDEKVSGIGHTPETTIGYVDTHEDAVDAPENEKMSTSTTASEKVATSEQSSVSTEIKADVVSPEIRHEVIDRKNVKPIENSAKDVLTNKRK